MILKVSLFFTYTGQDPVPFQLHPHHKEKNTLTNATEMAQEIIAMQENLQTQLIEAQDQQAVYYNKSHKQRTYKISD